MDAITDLQDMLITHTTDIVVSYVANNSLGSDDVSSLIRDVYGTLAGLGGENAEPEARPDPAVSIRSSVKKDHIVCLEDGKKLTMLKRYLQTNYGMTPQQYRAKWKLPADYPMVAPNYAEKRRTLAKAIGLGRKSGAAAPASKRGRTKK